MLISDFWANSAAPINQKTYLSDLMIILGQNIREWASAKLNEYESLRVSNGRVGLSRPKNGQVASRYASICTENFNFSMLNTM